MGRRIKQNADYFPHESGMRNDRRIKAVRAKFGGVAYQVYNMLMETMCEADMVCIPWNESEIAITANDFEVDPEQLKKIVDEMVKLDLIQNHNGHLLCRSLDARLNHYLFRKRAADLTRMRQEAGIVKHERSRKKGK